MPEKIAFFDTKPYDMEFFNKANEKYGFELDFFESRLRVANSILTKGCVAVCVFVNDHVDEEVIKCLIKQKVKIVALRSAGYNNVDLKAAYKKISVVRVPEYSPRSVAEHTIGLMLALNRKYHRAYNRTRDGNFSLNGLLGFDFFGKTASIIGTGRIGKALISILSGFGMNLLAYDINPDQNLVKQYNVYYTDLDTIFARADVISLNTPLTRDTYHLINNNAIDMMKDGVMIINTGRGGLIDTQALINGLKNKKIGFAGLDVYEEEEEYFFEDLSAFMIEDDTLARLMTFNNVIITSHQGFFTKEALTNIAETTLGNIQDLLDKGHSPNEIFFKPLNTNDMQSSRKST